MAMLRARPECLMVQFTALWKGVAGLLRADLETGAAA
jgi:hypothetical protein